VTSTSLADRLDTLRESPLARRLALAAPPARAWLVGGAVRDAALGRTRVDLDAVVDRDAAGVAGRLAQALGARLVRLGAEREGVFRVVLADAEIDLWDLAGGRLEDDLARRDFTVNAVACDLAGGEIVDPFDGLGDVERRRLRATRASVFDEDPLRVLRLARFAATLPGFTVAAETARLARARAPLLARVAGERIRQELVRLWTGAGWKSAQAALERSGAWPELWRHPSTAGRGDSAVAAAATLERVAATLVEAPRRPEADVAAGHALCARAAAGESAGAVVEELARRRVLTRRGRHDVWTLLGALAAPHPPGDDAGLASWLHRAGALHAEALGLAAAFAPATRRPAWEAAARRARALLAERGGEILEPEPLLSGGEIGELLGLPPGPELGAAAKALLEAQVRGEVRSVAAARRALAQRASRGGSDASGRSRSGAD
jgi:poly(A) polymerase